MVLADGGRGCGGPTPPAGDGASARYEALSIPRPPAACDGSGDYAILAAILAGPRARPEPVDDGGGSHGRVGGDAFDAAVALFRPCEARDGHLMRWVAGTRAWVLDAVGAWIAGGRGSGGGGGYVGGGGDVGCGGNSGGSGGSSSGLNIPHADVPRPLARVFWLHGDAGVGKSAVAAAVARRYGAAALHFLAHYNARTRSPALVVASIAGQLRATLTDYRPDPSLLAPLDGDTPAVLFQRVVLGPLGLCTPREPVLIVIDALDEGAVSGAGGDGGGSNSSGGEDCGGNEILAMLSALRAAPAWLRLFVTSRLQPAILAALGDAGYVLDSRCADNEADLRIALALALSGMGGPLSAEDAADALLPRAGGLFLYVKYVAVRHSRMRFCLYSWPWLHSLAPEYNMWLFGPQVRP